VDCEKFDKVVLEMLYDELDELTGAAAKRHMEHCSRCGSMGARLRATREVGVLPTIEPPVGLQERILRLERAARQALPLRERVGRTISVLAGYAMRPQLAMAALLLLMIGSSFLFLRAKPGDPDNVHVTERGVREADESVAIVPLPEPAAKSAPAEVAAPATENEKDREIAQVPPRGERVASALLEGQPATASAVASDEETTEDAYDQAMSAYRRGEYKVAQEQFEAIASEGGDRAPSARLFAAHAARSSSGCGEAASKFDTVHQQFPGTDVAQEAAWQAASCYRALGQLDQARAHYQRLLDAPAYADRAQHALARLDAQHAEMVASKSGAPPPSKPVTSTPAKTKASAAKSSRPAAPPATRATDTR
jgi:TolA-binding protein